MVSTNKELTSGKSSVCQFLPKHTEEDSPLKGLYQHLLTNEELISDKNVTPQQIKSQETSNDQWKDDSVLN